MKPTIEILERMKENSEKNKEEVFTRLYRYLLRPDLYFIAYQKLYSNNGAATEGADRDTADGFSETKVEKLIASLADESYCPKPSRRIYLKNRMANTAHWESLLLVTSWYRKYCAWCWKLFMNRYFWKPHMDSDREKAAIPHSVTRGIT